MPLVTSQGPEDAASAPLFLQEFLRFHGRHAAGAGSGDRLTVTAVLHVAASIDPGHSGENVIAGNEIAVFIGVELAVEHLGIGNMPDAEEDGAGGKIPEVAVGHVSHLKPGCLSLVYVVN